MHHVLRQPVLAQITNTDTDGATYARTKVVFTGMTFCLRSFELRTATPGSIVNLDPSGAACAEATASFYTSEGADASLTPADCVKTVVDFEPPFDYYIIGGQIRSKEVVLEDVRVHVVAVPDVPASMGGTKIMVQNLNLRYVGVNDKVQADGRAGKLLSHSSTYHTNKQGVVHLLSSGRIPVRPDGYLRVIPVNRLSLANSSLSSLSQFEPLGTFTVTYAFARSMNTAALPERLSTFRWSRLESSMT